MAGERGHFLAGEVGILAGVSGDRIGQWARWGYIRSSRSDGDPRVYAWEDAAEALVVHELEELGAALPAIHRAIERLRARDGEDRPLAAAAGRLGAVDGSVVEWVGGEAYDLGATEQGVLDVPDLERVTARLEHGGWAAHALGGVPGVEADAGRLGGRPAVRGRRLAAEDVARLAAQDGGREALREDYGLDDAEVDDAVRWWAEAERRAAG